MLCYFKICICFPKVLTIFLVNLNKHWAYKDCQFNNCILIFNIAGSFPFGAVVHGTCIYIYTYAKLFGTVSRSYQC